MRPSTRHSYLPTADCQDPHDLQASGPGLADAAAAQLSGLTLNTSNLRMSHASRAQLRASLGRGIQALKEKEQVQRVVDNDPLLGA